MPLLLLEVWMEHLECNKHTKTVAVKDAACLLVVVKGINIDTSLRSGLMLHQQLIQV